MSVKPTYVCNVCGAESTDMTHWFVAGTPPGGCLKLIPWDVSKSLGYLGQSYMKNLCGQLCINSFIGEWMKKL